MRYRFVHNNLNVFDLNKSLAFYSEALNLKEVRRISSSDQSFIIVYLGDGTSQHLLELTWLRDQEKAYDLGDNEFHIAFEVDDFEASLTFHKEKGWVCFENQEMGIYFIEDPDGYWVEILPSHY